jgi:hypothetical protein
MDDKEENGIFEIPDEITFGELVNSVLHYTSFRSE